MPGAARGEQIDSTLKAAPKGKWRSDESSSEEISVDSNLSGDSDLQEDSKYETVKFRSTVGMLKTKRTKKFKEDETTIKRTTKKRKRKIVLKKKLEAEG